MFHWMSIESFYHIYRITCGLVTKKNGKQKEKSENHHEREEEKQRENWKNQEEMKTTHRKKATQKVLLFSCID